MAPGNSGSEGQIITPFHAEMMQSNKDKVRAQ